MRKSIELRQQRAAKVEAAGKLLKTAEREGRALTETETEKFNALHREAEGLLSQIAQAEAEEGVSGDGSAVRLALHQPANRDASQRVLGADAILGSGETFESRARAMVGESGSDCRFYHMLRASLGGDVKLTEEETRALASGSGAAGGFTVPAITSGQILDKMAAAMQVFNAGAQKGILPPEGGEFVFPRHASGPGTQWVSENETLTEASVTFDGLRIEPRILACGPVKVPRKLLDQSAVDMEAWIGAAMAREMAVEADRAALYGAGSANEPSGLVTQLPSAHIDNVGGAANRWDDILDNIKLCEDDNAPGTTALLLNPDESNGFAKLVDSDKNPLTVPPKVAAIPHLVTSQVTAGEIFHGHFPHMTVFFQGKVRLLPLRERYADALQVGFISYVYVDVMVSYPNSFGQLTGITSIASS